MATEKAGSMILPLKPLVRKILPWKVATSRKIGTVKAYDHGLSALVDNSPRSRGGSVGEQQMSLDEITQPRYR